MKRGFVHRPQKNCSFEAKSRVEIRRFFTRCSFPKKICKTCANIFVLDLRFLWLVAITKLHFKNVFLFCCLLKLALQSGTKIQIRFVGEKKPLLRSNQRCRYLGSNPTALKYFANFFLLFCFVLFEYVFSCNVIVLGEF
jgi:hypothetical protein